MTATEFVPAEVFHASDYIAEECIARGWSLWDLAERSGAPDTAFAVLGWEFYAIREADMLMGDDGAAELERALGINAEFWLNTEASYRKHAASRSSVGPHVAKWYGLDEPAAVSSPRTLTDGPLNDQPND